MLLCYCVLSVSTIQKESYCVRTWPSVLVCFSVFQCSTVLVFQCSGPVLLHSGVQEGEFVYAHTVCSCRTNTHTHTHTTI